MDISTVNNLIECRRSELNMLASVYGIRDQRVLVKSVELDRIINVYIRKKKSKEPMNQQINSNHDRTVNTSATKTLIGVQ